MENTVDSFNYTFFFEGADLSEKSIAHSNQSINQSIDHTVAPYRAKKQMSRVCCDVIWTVQFRNPENTRYPIERTLRELKKLQRTRKEVWEKKFGADAWTKIFWNKIPMKIFFPVLTKPISQRKLSGNPIFSQKYPETSPLHSVILNGKSYQWQRWQNSTINLRTHPVLDGPEKKVKTIVLALPDKEPPIPLSRKSEIKWWIWVQGKANTNTMDLVFLIKNVSAAFEHAGTCGQMTAVVREIRLEWSNSVRLSANVVTSVRRSGWDRPNHMIV